MSAPIKVFYSYTPEDETILVQLAAYLDSLHGDWKIDGWHHAKVRAGDFVEHEVVKHLTQAQMVLVLLSHHFFAEEYYQRPEVQRILEYIKVGEKPIVPIILDSPAIVEGTPFALLQCLPSNEKSIRDSNSRIRDFHHIVFGIVKVIEYLRLDNSQVNGLGSKQIPLSLTRGQIEYQSSLLIPQPIQYYSLFISYAHQDETIAKRLHADLVAHNVPCWFAPHDLRPGTPILRGLEEAISFQDKFLLIISKHAVNSTWIEREIDAALHEEIKRGTDVLFPIRLDNTVLESKVGWATRLQHRHISDLTNWQDETAYQQALTTLLRHLKVDRSSAL